MEEVPTGRMADLNCISKKTLRVYQEAGVLEPARIDEENGYRFYTYEQCATLDMVQQLQGLGVSLAEIKALLDSHSIDNLSDTIHQHLEQLSEEQFRLELAQHNARRLLQNCRMIQSRPLFDTIILEHIPARRIIRFPILHETAVHLDEDASTYLFEWEMNLRLTKQHMLKSGLPLELFHHIGCSITRENLLARTLDLCGSFILIENSWIADHFDARTLPEGDYVTLYKSSYTEDDGKSSEVVGLKALLDFIAASDLEINGNYYGEIIADSPAFLYEGREMLYKLQIPVVRKNAA